MAVFSERYNLAPEKAIQFKSIDLNLFNRLWNIFYKREYVTEPIFVNCPGNVEDMLDSFGQTYKYPKSRLDINENIEKLREYLIDANWYEIYDFIEKYIALFAYIGERNSLQKELNVVLEQEKAGYRIIKGLVTPIINDEELQSLQKSMNTKYESVNRHFEKALELYSNRKNPDYENSVKESISAVEAMCCIITGTNGSQATLGAAIKRLKNKGVYIHPAMEKAFLSLYGYTSDENGIRHGGIDFTNVPAEDAKYMLVSCSSFVNYLIEKWSKCSTK